MSESEERKKYQAEWYQKNKERIKKKDKERGQKRKVGVPGYKRPVRGRIPSRQLFEDGTYSLEEFHDIFLSEKDPTEYKAAIKTCGSWKEWQRLKSDWPTFKSLVNEWQEELAILLRSEAVEKIIQLTDGEDAKALSAAKFLSESAWLKRSGQRGRPSAAERKREARELAKAASETKEEESRILRVINGSD